MLRGRSPWGLEGAVYLLVACSQSFIDVRSSILSIGGQGMLSNAVYPCWIIQVLSRGTVMAVLCEGVLSVVVFEISPSHVKTFHYAPRRTQPPLGLLARAVRRLCVGSG
jgi:sensor histidine kinase YesM